MTKLILPVAVAVLGALLVTSLTPLGERIRESLFPTRATVSGKASLEGQPAAGAILEMDGVPAGQAGPDGAFQLGDVRSGQHRLNLHTLGGKPKDVDFTVSPRQSTVDLGQIDIEPLLTLGYSASIAPPSQAMTVDYEITLWLIGEQADLAAIRSVNYVLPSPLPPAPVPANGLELAFCYRQSGTLDFQELFDLGGAFSTATGQVALAEGPSFSVSGLPGDVRPPVDCPVVDVGTTSGASSGGSSTGGSGGGSSGGSGGGTNSQTTVVPVLTGLTLDEAGPLLSAARLALGQVTMQESDSPANTILSVAPPETTTVAVGSAVALVVSSGQRPVEIPAVVGLPIEEARALLTQAGFEAVVTEEKTDQAPVGTVLWQEPPGGGSALPGSRVTITVATAP
jgi:uncharacterized membrane protein YgcG